MINNRVIILAAGKSMRFGEDNKIFCEVSNKPLITYCLDFFQWSFSFKEIVIVTSEEHKKKLEEIINRYSYTKISKIVLGGKERQDSVYKGLKYLGTQAISGNDRVFIHNGANPVVTTDEIDRLLEAQKVYGSAVLGRFSVDTVKLINKDNTIQKGVDRSRIFCTQTPQVSTYKKLMKAYKYLFKLPKRIVTDEAEALELVSERVKVVEASEYNCKITYKRDLVFFEYLVAQGYLY